MSTLPQMIKELTASVQQLNTTMTNGFAALQKQAQASAQPEDIEPVLDGLKALDAKVDTVVAQVSDVPAPAANSAS